MGYSIPHGTLVFVAGMETEEGGIRRIGPLFQRERFASGLRVVERFQVLGEKYGKSPAQVAIAWVLAQPGVVCALTGPSTIPHLEENLGGSGWTIAPDDLEELERFFQDKDEWMRQEQVQSVRAILRQELEPKSAFADLVYVFETLIERGLAAEEEILPLFQRLWVLRGQCDASALQTMRGVQAELHQMLAANHVAASALLHLAWNWASVIRRA